LKRTAKVIDIYKYINSADLREYLEKMEYKPDILQSVFIIETNTSLSVKEKHRGFKEIIENMPDCPLKLNIRTEKSLHRYLEKIIKEEETTINAVEQNFYDTYTYYLLKDGVRQKNDKKYNDFKECLSAALAENDGYITILGYKSTEKYPDIYLSYSPKGTLLSFFNKLCEENSLRELPLSNLMDLPMPFKKGDVVEMLNEEMIPLENRLGPIVIISPLPENNMMLNGFYIDHNGVLSNEAYFLCTEIEYFRKNLTKEQEQLLSLTI